MFEKNEIITWGIPGWVFLTWMLLISYNNYSNEIREFLATNPFESLTITTLIAGIGVPIGYMIYQLYFAMYWSLSSKVASLEKLTDRISGFSYPQELNEIDLHERYYYLNYIWDSYLLGLDESKREHIKGIYNRLISKVHGIGTLLFSLVVSFLISLLFLINIIYQIEFNLILTIFICVQVIMIIILYNNFRYFSIKIFRFQGYLLNEKFGSVENSDPNTNSDVDG
jgi:hypothetical protein